jgi:chromosome segregation ATPase
VPYASVSQLNGMLAQLEQASQATQADLGKVRIERWKTDSGNKKQSLENVDSIKRNLESALPELINQLRLSPEDLAASFKLYRNLDALYDVLGSVAESAGAFGSKEEFRSLSNDLNTMERSRRAFADRLESLTATKESELSQLRTQIKTLQAATPPPPPKKVVVDDTVPPKPAGKKKTAQKTTKSPVPPVQPTPPQPQ